LREPHGEQDQEDHAASQHNTGVGQSDCRVQSS
jgi:hypothetical protein